MPERLQAPARTDLCRTAGFTLERAEPDGDGGDGLTIRGYGAVFNSVTHISSWEGDFDEVIAPGAFKKSLREGTPKMQFDHGRHPLLGSLPLGRWTVAEEDQRGLLLEGRLTDNWLVLPFREAIRDGGVEGMSFRFAVARDEWTDNQGKRIREDELPELLFRGPGDRGPILRTLKELRVSEAGPVVWPAYADTEVGVRSASDGRRIVTIDLGSLHSGQETELQRLARLVSVADRATRTHGPDGEPEPTDEPVETPPEFVDDLAGDAQSDLPATDASSEQDDTGTNDAEPASDSTTDSDSTEPRTTDRSAGRHPSAEDAPPTTDQSAGEHSPARAANPTDRAAAIRAEYRERLDRLLAIPHD